MENQSLIEMSEKIEMLNKKVKELTNDLITLKINNCSLFNKSCKLCSKRADVLYGMDCYNNKDLFFYVCKECKELNDIREEKMKKNNYDSLVNQHLYLK